MKIEIYKTSRKNENINWFKNYDFTELLNRKDGRTLINIEGYGEIKVSEARKIFQNLKNVELMVLPFEGRTYSIKEYRDDLFNKRVNYYF